MNALCLGAIAGRVLRSHNLSLAPIPEPRQQLGVYSIWAEVANAPVQIDRVPCDGYNERSIARAGVANIEQVNETGSELC